MVQIRLNRLVLFCFFTLLLASLVPVVMADAAAECEAEQCVATELNAAATLEGAGGVEDLDPKCPDRDHIIRCAGAHLDKNGNGKLDRVELENAIASLPWYARGILQILGSVDKMMKKCDIDGDDAIGMEYDMQNNKETCLATCFKRRAFKNAFFPECDL